MTPWSAAKRSTRELRCPQQQRVKMKRAWHLTISSWREACLVLTQLHAQTLVRPRSKQSTIPPFEHFLEWIGQTQSELTFLTNCDLLSAMSRKLGDVRPSPSNAGLQAVLELHAPSWANVGKRHVRSAEQHEADSQHLKKPYWAVELPSRSDILQTPRTGKGYQTHGVEEKQEKLQLYKGGAGAAAAAAAESTQRLHSGLVSLPCVLICSP